MKIHGHGLQDHLRLVTPLLGLIASVWALRLIASAAGAPHGVASMFSVSVAVPICVLLAVLLMHFRRFGSYPNVVMVTFLLVFWGQVLISAAIGFYALTGKQNIYSIPEYSFGGLSAWKHVAGHLTFGVGFGTLVGTGMGCLFLWMLRKLPEEPAHHLKQR
jgi:hypothetical protein